MARISNNPRGFDRLVSIRATWEPIGQDGRPGVLRCAVNFSHQIIGRAEDSPITFKLELSGAELLVTRPSDTAFLEDSVLQPAFVQQELDQRLGGGSAEVEMGAQSLKLGVQSGESVQTRSFVSTFLKSTTQDGEGNPIFEFCSDENSNLRGPAWDGFKEIAKIKSLSPPKPYDPEPVFYLRAAGENLKIVDPVLKSRKSRNGWSRSANKRLVALAYLQKTLVDEFSLEVTGKLEDKHSLATLVRYEPQTVHGDED